ncbi:MAG: hypothetical protein F3741_08365 [Nitrospinae bacterium]|nr:hypothetical protein [Nitrospinota bacterium]
MKKLAMVLIVTVASFCLTSTAFAADLAPGQTAKCNNAKSITLENTGGGDIDRGEGNASIWKSSNFTTVPISLSPNANNGFPGNGGGAAGNAKVHMSSKHSMGAKKVVLSSQPEFSRGDSIGDISGEVRITNTGTTNLSVSCG